MSIAELVAMEITKHRNESVACTLDCGYMILNNGDRRLFQVGRIVQHARNKEGRTTMVLAEYPDRSQLRFNWSESTGGRYTVVE